MYNKKVKEHGILCHPTLCPDKIVLKIETKYICTQFKIVHFYKRQFWHKKINLCVMLVLVNIQ